MDFCNGNVRRVLTARSNTFTWNIACSGVRYCPNTEPAPSLYQSVSNSYLSSTSGSVRRLRDLAPNSSAGFASMRERRLFQINRELSVVKPIEEPLTHLTLASFSKDQILKTLSDLHGNQIDSTNFRTTFIQYLQLCRCLGIQFRVPLSGQLTQCLVCLQYANISQHRFKCECIQFKFSILQDCNCNCGTSFFCCTCDDIPPICYDLDVLADYVTAVQQMFQSMFKVSIGHLFTNLVMSLIECTECLGIFPDESALIRLSQFKPP